MRLADDLFRWATTQVEWRREVLKLFGRDLAMPREVSWFGDGKVCYRYSGIDHIARGWPAGLGLLRERLAQDFDFQSNFVLLNCYRSGSDSMGWHTDDEPELRGLVASVSVGATRHLLLRCGRNQPSSRLLLGHGALLMHHRDLYHCLPKTKKPINTRINLTFRQVYAYGKSGT